MTSSAAAEESTFAASKAGFIGLTAFGGAIVGFFLQLLVAFYFGASSQTDAFFMAQSTSEMLSKLLLGGSITAVFLPLFVERLTRGQRRLAWDLALNLLHLTGAAFLLLLILLFFFTTPFVKFIAPGFDAATKALTVNLLRLLLPSFLLLFFVELTSAMLHSLKQFTWPALLRLIAPLVSIVSIILLAPQIGIFALAVGVVTGSVLQLSLLAWGLSRQGFTYRFIFRPTDPTIRKLLVLVYPFILSVLVTQGAGITYRILVSDLSSGSLAALKFAEKITQLMALMFLNSVTVVIYPLLSAKAAAQDAIGIQSTISFAIRLIVFLTLPAITGAVLLREPLIRFLYQRGSFTPEDAAMTSVALLFLVIGLTTNGLSSVLGHAVLALQQTRAAVAITIASQAVAISLFILLVPPLAHAGLALASSLVPLSSGLLYFLFLRPYLPRPLEIFKHATYLKTFALTTLLALAVYISGRLTINLPLPSQPALLLHLIIPTLIGTAVYFFGAYLWGVTEMKTITSIISTKLDNWRHLP